MSNPITVEHHGITITYREKDNRWAFELRGRQRSSESLAKAQEAIDKPINETEEKPFSRMPIYIQLKYGGNGYQKAEITSIAESQYGSSKTVWVSRGKERSKENAYFCFAFNDANTKIVNEVADLQKQIDDLKKQRDDKAQTLQRVEI